MIEAGYNGINFGEYSEEHFLNSIPKSLIPFFKKFTHRDTQECEKMWRAQGTIKIDDFNNALKEVDSLSRIDAIQFDYLDNSKYIITIRVLNTSKL